MENAGLLPVKAVEVMRDASAMCPFSRDPSAHRVCLNPPSSCPATGFADQSHSTKIFRRLVGITPAQFRAAGATTRCPELGSVRLPRG
jgi:hypothetical protein